MMADAMTCEWTPASNRSTVDPIEAVFRLGLPPAIRGAFISKMRRHAYDDVVTIRRDGITSDSGAGQYDAVISRMNFASGRLCRAVTRNKWTAAQREGAVVYVVGEYALGYAAACGNLFVLTRRPDAPPAQTQPAAAAMEPGGGAPVSGPVAPEPAKVETFASASLPPMPAPVIPWQPIPGGGIVIVPPPISAVPEPGTWAMFLAGLGMALRSAARRAVR